MRISRIRPRLHPRLPYLLLKGLNMSEFIAVNRRLLALVVDREPCKINDDNSCVTHGFEFLRPGEDCPQYQLKVILAENVRGESGA